MEFKTHLQILRACRIYRGNITKGALIRQIYQLIDEHKGKDFTDIDDLFTKLYPNRVVQPVAGGVHIRHKGRSGHQRRRPKKDLTPFAEYPQIEEQTNE